MNWAQQSAGASVPCCTNQKAGCTLQVGAAKEGGSAAISSHPHPLSPITGEAPALFLGVTSRGTEEDAKLTVHAFPTMCPIYLLLKTLFGSVHCLGTICNTVRSTQIHYKGLMVYSIWYLYRVHSPLLCSICSYTALASICNPLLYKLFSHICFISKNAPRSYISSLTSSSYNTDPIISFFSLTEYSGCKFTFDVQLFLFSDIRFLISYPPKLMPYLLWTGTTPRDWWHYLQVKSVQ